MGPLPLRTSPQDGRSYWWFDKEFDDKGWKEIALPVEGNRENRWGGREDFLARLRFDFKPGTGKLLLGFEMPDPCTAGGQENWRSTDRREGRLPSLVPSDQLSGE